MTTCREVLKAMLRDSRSLYVEIAAKELLTLMKTDTTASFLDAACQLREVTLLVASRPKLNDAIECVIQEVLISVGKKKLARTIRASSKLAK